MIVSFADEGTADVFNGASTKLARRCCPEEIWPVAKRKLDMIHYAAALKDLKVPPNNKLHVLKQDRAGQHAIRINDQYRICFRWTDAGVEDVEITDYH